MIYDQNDGSMVEKVEVTVHREMVSCGPLFPKKTKYMAKIKVTTDRDEWSEWEKDFGMISFDNVQRQLEEMKAEAVSKGLDADRYIIQYGKTNAS